ncbi:MAG TPA: YifB family Mg chelatase-like AAA ATPase [Solirubrobacterales bacterium]|nr:YifB family Mg chelatase-like AAA ATPase [Solirubrobacterales bacterium]
MLASARTFALVGIEAREVQVEVDVAGGGLPSFSLVGLPDAAVRESRERVRAALVNSGFEFPMQRITANLAPADLPKVGPGFDLAIAAALLAASGQLPPERLQEVALAGELALDGSVRPVPGILAMAEAARRVEAPAIAVPAHNAVEAALAGEPRVVPLDRLRELRLLGTEDEPATPPRPAWSANGALPVGPDLADLRGQPYLRYALEVAAAGGHSLLIVGPPGAGKSLAARRLPSIMPPLRRSEAMEVLRIASACGRVPRWDVPPARPFRAPHHTISTAGLVGGGSPPRAGEVTLSHRGVLFLDELAEFSREALEALRQPLEEGRVAIVRARHAIDLPCRFMLVAASNPCPCGRGEESGECECQPASVRRYRAKLSGALADRIDIAISVERPSAEVMGTAPASDSATVRRRVIAARERQERRLGSGRCNAEMNLVELRRAAEMTPEAKATLAAGHAQLGLSGRGHDRVLRLSRTIADLDGCGQVSGDHVARALTLRRRGLE